MIGPYPSSHNEVCLWPPEDDDIIWTVIVIENGRYVDHEIDDYDKARAFAKNEAIRIGVVGWVPTNDGDSRDL